MVVIPVQRLLCTVVMVAGLGLWGAASTRGDETLLPGAEANKHWHVPPTGGQAVFVPTREGEEPCLVLPREAARRGTVVLQVVSDAKSCVVESGKALFMEVPLLPDQNNGIALDGASEVPTVKVNDRELPAMRGRWIGLVLKSTEPGLTVRFVGGTYANVTFGAVAPPPERVALPVAPGAIPELTPGANPGAGLKPGVPTIVPPSLSGVPGAWPPPTAVPEMSPSVWPGQYPEAKTIPAENAAQWSPIPGETSQITEAPDLWRFSFRAAVELPSAYYYRGIAREDHHVIIQPMVDTVLRVYDGSGDTAEGKILDYVDLDFGFRSSHDWGGVWGGNVPYTKKWQEFDWHGGVTFGLLDRWSLGLQYENLESTSFNFRAVHQVNFRLGFDDRDPDYSWSLQPYGLLSAEFEDQSDGGFISLANATSGKFHRGAYLELGVQPQFALFELTPRSPVTLEVPAKIGLSLSNYYEDHLAHDNTFGYFETGFDLGVPIATFPAAGHRRFQWKLTAGFHLLFLGDSTRDLGIINGAGAKSVVPIGKLGISLDF